MTRARDIADFAGVVDQPLSNRNLLYNGAMQVAQRGTSTAGITTFGYYTADRWSSVIATLGTWTQTIENDAPAGSGLRNSLKLLCTTADASLAAGDNMQIQHALEGQDVQRIAKGTANAQQLTLSFWVKSNVTGTYVARLVDMDNTRHVAASYTISASATWEKKTITFPADTTGAFDNDNGESFRLQFWLGAGTNFTSGTLATAWGSNVSANAAVGQANVAAATNNYWQVTGVQLEVGDTATEFEHLPYGVELARCQRYYQNLPFYTQVTGCFNAGSNMSGANSFPTMRTTPTATSNSATATLKTQNSTSFQTHSSWTFFPGSPNQGFYSITTTRTLNQVCSTYTDTGATVYLSAEL